MMPFISKEALQRLRDRYKPGTRVELLHMDDVQAPPIGTKGTVIGVDDIGSIPVPKPPSITRFRISRFP